MEEEVVVGVGEYHVRHNPHTLVCIGLGSCVGVAIYDLNERIGGLAHVMLPKYGEGRDKVNACKYADSSIYMMIDDIIENGGRRRSLKAKIAGGAQMFSFISSENLNIGRRNVEAVKDALEQEGVPLIGEDVGGSRSRTVIFDSRTGVLTVRKDNKIFEI